MGTTSPFSKRVYSTNLTRDVGLADVFPGSAAVEQEAVRMIGEIFSKPSASGNIVSGGTEANIIALWAARNMTQKKKVDILYLNLKLFG